MEEQIKQERSVCVITGGGSGMGLAAAKCMPKEKTLLLSGRTEKKLEKAREELLHLGYTVYTKACDTSDRQSVRALAEYAASLGNVKNVINSAGLSPNMADPKRLYQVNALGTVYINQEFAKVMRPGSVIVDIASNSAYALPKFLINQKIYALADRDEALFLKKMQKKCSIAKEGYQRSGMAYAFSKNFVVWYAAKSAFELGPKGIRVVSLSPGLIDTDMGKLEKEEGGALIPFTAENRMGTPEELGFAIAMTADERNGYLAGVDILCDGGSVLGKKFKR